MPTARSPKSQAMELVASQPGLPTRPRPARATKSSSKPMPGGVSAASMPAPGRIFASPPRWASQRCNAQTCRLPAEHGSKARWSQPATPTSSSLSTSRTSACRATPGRRSGKRSAATRSFPHQTNVEFVRMSGRDEIEIRIYERGVGPTSSSGTGTCAAGAQPSRCAAPRQCCA